MDTKYTGIMEEGINNKSILKQFIDYNMDIVDVGASTGALTFELASGAGRKTQVIAIEPEESTFKVLQSNVSTFKNVVTVKQMFQDVEMEMPKNIVFSSVLHHMLQYRDKHTFEAMRHWFKNVPDGSRVLIRDGVRPSPRRASEVIGLVCTPRSLNLAKRFLKDFYIMNIHNPKELIGGAPYTLDFEIDGCTVWAQRWLITEMMLTITWGEESMKRECLEWYTIMGIEDYIQIFESLGYKTLYAESLIQPGYQIFLPKLGKLVNRQEYEIPWPFTNQILAFEK
jgi:SAM-dependent methyltransferase